MSLEKLLSENMRRFGTKNLNLNSGPGPFTTLVMSNLRQFPKISHKAAAGHLDKFDTLNQYAKLAKKQDEAVPAELYEYLFDEVSRFKRSSISINFTDGELYNSAIELLKAYKGYTRITSFLAPEFVWYRDELLKRQTITKEAKAINEILKYIETILNDFNHNERFRK